MPAALRLDTLKFAKRLTEAGLPAAAAEAIVEGLNDADTSELASKADIGDVKAEIAAVKTEVAAVKAEVAAVKGEIAALAVSTSAGFASVRAEAHSEIATLRADLYGRLWAMGLGIVGLTVALLRLLPG